MARASRAPPTLGRPIIVIMGVRKVGVRDHRLTLLVDLLFTRKIPIVWVRVSC